MEYIKRQVSNSRRLFEINADIISWDLKKRHGLQQWRGQDKYGFIELNIYELENYKKEINNELSTNFKSYIDWQVDESLFPKELYNLYIEELKVYADFISSYIAALKGESLNFIFQITFAGFHPIDSCRPHTYGKALIEAVISCFNKESYSKGELHKQQHHSLDQIKYKMHLYTDKN